MTKLRIYILLALLLVDCGCSQRGDGYWGDSDGTLRIHLDVVYDPGARQHFASLVFQNVSKKSIIVWDSGFWPNTLLKCSDANGVPAQLTPQGTKLLKAFSPGGARDKNSPLRLAPNQVRRSGDNTALERAFVLQPSKTYRVTATYEERQEEGWAGSVTSNAAYIRGSEGYEQ
jgi:hypothetical protein